MKIEFEKGKTGNMPVFSCSFWRKRCIFLTVFSRIWRSIMHCRWNLFERWYITVGVTRLLCRGKTKTAPQRVLFHLVGMEGLSRPLKTPTLRRFLYAASRPNERRPNKKPPEGGLLFGTDRCVIDWKGRESTQVLDGKVRSLVDAKTSDMNYPPEEQLRLNEKGSNSDGLKARFLGKFDRREVC